jgi:hypothetical protein
VTTIDPFFGPDDAALVDVPPAEPVLPAEYGVYPHGDPVTFTVPGEPVPWAPMQRNQRTGQRFTAPRQAKATTLITAKFESLGVGRIPKPFGVVLGCTFTVERPAGHWRSGRNSNLPSAKWTDYPTGRPDLSNLIKLVEDALTKLAWDDDDQVVLLHNPRKAYSDRAQTIVRIWLAPGRLVDKARDYVSLDAGEGEPEAPQLAL